MIALMEWGLIHIVDGLLNHVNNFSVRTTKIKTFSISESTRGSLRYL